MATIVKIKESGVWAIFLALLIVGSCVQEASIRVARSIDEAAESCRQPDPPEGQP